MEKKDFEKILTEILKPADFKKKGNFWTLNNHVLTKMVNLQKSQFSNRFYINYGFIINEIPLNNLKMHVYNRLTALKKSTNEEIINMLDLDFQIPDAERESRLRNLLYENLIMSIIHINTEADLLAELQQRDHLNDVPLYVKDYLARFDN